MSGKFVAVIVGIVCTTIVMLSLGLFYFANKRTEIFVKNGYTRTTLAGYSGAQWVKDVNEIQK